MKGTIKVFMYREYALVFYFTILCMSSTAQNKIKDEILLRILVGSMFLFIQETISIKAAFQSNQANNT